MGILDYGAGAAQGLEQLLARQLAEERFAEEKRQALAHETLTGRQIDESAATRRDTLAATNAERLRQDEDRNQNRIRQTVNFRPVGSEVMPQEKMQERAAGIPEAMYKENLSQLPSRTISGGVVGAGGGGGRQIATPRDMTTGGKAGNITWVGTEAQREAQQRIDSAGANDVERVETPGGPTGKTINFIPKAGIAGKSYSGYTPPVQPVVIQTSEGPQMLDKGTRTTRPITEAGTGEIVAPMDPAMVRQQKRNARTVRSHIPAIRQEVDQVNAMGLMGPVGGRWADFAAGTWGSAEDLKDIGYNITPEQSVTLNKFRDDIGFLQSGMAMVHGGQRGGGSIAMNKKMEGFINAKKMDRNGVEGALRSFDSWLEGYQADPARAIATDPDTVEAGAGGGGQGTGGAGKVTITSIRQIP